MKLEWLGHSCFKFITSTGTTVITDPYDSYIGKAMPQTNADIVTVSHSHDDHSAVHLIGGTPTVLNTEGTVNLKDIHIYSIMSYHDNQKGEARGQNLVFNFFIDNINICHLGDIGEERYSRLDEIITPTNVLLIPIGGKYTINAIQAKNYVDILQPNIILPMHYATKDVILDISSANGFLDLFSDEDIININGNSINIEKDDFNTQKTKVIVFNQ